MRGPRRRRLYGSLARWTSVDGLPRACKWLVEPVCLRVLIIYNTATGEPGSRNAPSPEISLFLKNTQITENLWKPMVFKQFLLSRKFTSRNQSFFLSHVLANIRRPPHLCRTSAVKIKILFWRFHLRLCIIREVHEKKCSANNLRVLKKNYYKTPLSLTILTKHRVRLRCRWSCEIDRTSAVALLENSETPLFLS